MKSVHDYSLLLCIALALSLAACNVGLPSAAGPTAPCAVATSAAERLIQRIAQQSATNGQTVTITATSEEVSSLLVMFLDEAKRRNPNQAIPIEHPTVCFQHGKLTLTGTVTLEGNTLNALITASPSLNAGKLAFKVEDVQLGPFPVPRAFNDEISTMINNSLNRYLDRVTISDISIQDGQLSITGKVS